MPELLKNRNDTQAPALPGARRRERPVVPAGERDACAEALGVDFQAYALKPSLSGEVELRLEFKCWRPRDDALALYVRELGREQRFRVLVFPAPPPEATYVAARDCERRGALDLRRVALGSVLSAYLGRRQGWPRLLGASIEEGYLLPASSREDRSAGFSDPTGSDEPVLCTGASLDGAARARRRAHLGGRPGAARRRVSLAEGMVGRAVASLVRGPRPFPGDAHVAGRGAASNSEGEEASAWPWKRSKTTTIGRFDGCAPVPSRRVQCAERDTPAQGHRDAFNGSELSAASNKVGGQAAFEAKPFLSV